MKGKRIKGQIGKFLDLFTSVSDIIKNMNASIKNASK
jgi:hypothetical protein